MRPNGEQQQGKTKHPKAENPSTAHHLLPFRFTPPSLLHAPSPRTFPPPYLSFGAYTQASSLLGVPFLSTFLNEIPVNSVATSFSSGLAGFSKDRDSVPSTQPHLAQRKDTADTHRMSSGVTGGDCDHSQFPTLSLSQLSVPNPGESVWCHKRL